MCRKALRPQVNKSLRKEGKRNVVKVKLFSLRKQNRCLCNNYLLVDANKKMLWKQKSWGSKYKNVEDAKIYIVR